MRLVGLVALTGVLAASCVIRGGGGQPEAGPEQFVFAMVPGSGSGPHAVAAVDEAIGEDVTEADHVASVDTPMGRFDLYRYVGTMGNGGDVMECEATVGVTSASAACGDLSEPRGKIVVAGIGSDAEWSTIDIRAGEGVASLVATSADGVVYHSNILSGMAMIMVPTRRGDLTVQGLDREGAPIGEPVPADLPFAGRVAPGA